MSCDESLIRLIKWLLFCHSLLKLAASDSMEFICHGMVWQQDLWELCGQFPLTMLRGTPMTLIHVHEDLECDM